MDYLVFVVPILLFITFLLPSIIKTLAIVKLNDSDKEVIRNYLNKIKKRRLLVIFSPLILSVLYILFYSESIVITILFLIAFILLFFTFLFVFPLKDYIFYKNNISSTSYLNTIKIGFFIQFIGLIITLLLTYYFLN